MTKQELIAKMGNEDRANSVMEELLRNVKPDFIRMILKAKSEEMEKIVKEREISDYYMRSVKLPDGFNFWEYQVKAEAGDTNAKEALELYNSKDERERERDFDIQRKNFWGNMYGAFCSH